MPFLTLPLIDVDQYNQLVKKIDRQVYQAPINASIDNQGHIVPERVGYRLNHQAFTEQFYAFLFGSGPNQLEVPLQTIYPKVDSELLADIRVQKIGQYVTYFNTHNKNRSHNLLLAAKAINNYVVLPGETFSFNQIVGMRTSDKGYMRAPVIVKGELSEGIGGGICQVSSTLYNAIDRAGMQIVERYSHSRSVPYIPPGRDATVSWYGPDFRFKNIYNQPILIRTNTHHGKLIINIYSSDRIVYKIRKVPNVFNR